jgi:hypothetical protein
VTSKTSGTHGIRALEACAVEDPTGFIRTVASLMHLDVGVDAAQFVTTFRQAIELLGNEPPMLSRRSRRKEAHGEQRLLAGSL